MSSGQFWNMGGYALYVWGSFAAAAIVFAWNVIAVRMRRREVERRLTEHDETDDAR